MLAVWYIVKCGPLNFYVKTGLKNCDVISIFKVSGVTHLILIQPVFLNSPYFSMSLQGADKTVKGPDGLTAFEATDNQAIKTLLQ